MVLKGLAIPMRVTSGGRSAIVSGDDHAEVILAVALGDCDNNNAFQQDRGLVSGEVVFAVISAETKAKVARRLATLFRQFERDALFKLITDSVQWEEDEDEQELILSFDYINLETDERKTFSKTFSLKRG